MSEKIIIKIISYLAKLIGYRSMMGMGGMCYLYIRPKDEREVTVTITGEALYENGDKVKLKIM